MRTIGLDIGTTSISAVVSEDGRVIHSVTEQSNASIKSDFPENRLQSVDVIINKVFSVKEKLIKEFGIEMAGQYARANELAIKKYKQIIL